MSAAPSPYRPAIGRGCGAQACCSSTMSSRRRDGGCLRPRAAGRQGRARVDVLALALVDRVRRQSPVGTASATLRRTESPRDWPPVSEPRMPKVTHLHHAVLSLLPGRETAAYVQEGGLRGDRGRRPPGAARGHDGAGRRRLHGAANLDRRHPCRRVRRAVRARERGRLDALLSGLSAKDAMTMSATPRFDLVPRRPHPDAHGPRRRA